MTDDLTSFLRESLVGHGGSWRLFDPCVCGEPLTNWRSYHDHLTAVQAAALQDLASSDSDRLAKLLNLPEYEPVGISDDTWVTPHPGVPRSRLTDGLSLFFLRRFTKGTAPKEEPAT